MKVIFDLTATWGDVRGYAKKIRKDFNGFNYKDIYFGDDVAIIKI